MRPHAVFHACMAFHDGLISAHEFAVRLWHLGVSMYPIGNVHRLIMACGVV